MGCPGRDFIHGGLLDLFRRPPNIHKAGDVIWQLGQGKDAIKVLFLNPRGDVSFWNGFMTVVPMVFGSAFLMLLVSMLTRPPSKQTIDKYFSISKSAAAPATAPATA